MGDYVRTTHECTLASLNPLLANAIRTHIENHAYGDIEASTLMCCETTSTKTKKGLFGKTEVILSGVIFSAQWLIVASGKEKEIPGVVSAPLREIQASDYEKSDLYKLIQDTGLNITGLRTDTADTGSIFIGLGPEPAAQKFRELLKEAIIIAQ